MIKKFNGVVTHFGLCDSCKKEKDLEDFCGLKLCHKCEEEFFEPLSQMCCDNEYGKDIVNNEKRKQGLKD
jgi:hypothetical protein